MSKKVVFTGTVMCVLFLFGMIISSELTSGYGGSVRSTFFYYTGNYNYVDLYVNGEYKGKLPKSPKVKKCLIKGCGTFKWVHQETRKIYLDWDHNYTVEAKRDGKSSTIIHRIPKWDSKRLKQNKRPRVVFSKPTFRKVDRNVEKKSRMLNRKLLRNNKSRARNRNRKVAPYYEK